jgi:hypothetical protein
MRDTRYMETLSSDQLLDGGVNPEIYLQLLNDVLEPYVGEMPLAIRHRLCFQLDEEPSEVRSWLDALGPGDKSDGHQDSRTSRP